MNQINQFLFLLIFFLQFSITFSYQYVFYKNRLFPIDTESRQITFGNGTNHSTTTPNTTNQCTESLMGDTLCDSTNNNEDCLYDKGDCCRATCLATCVEKGLTGSACRCGENSYNCKSDNAPCEQCVHGKCETNMSLCYSEDEYVRIAVGACSLNGMVQGTTNTSDYYCGKDPDKTAVHYSSTPNYHFPGCGIQSINCTENPCCEVVNLNHDTYDNCDYTPKSMYIWDPTKKSYTLQFTSCLNYYRQCFKENAASFPRGECCQCDEGWGGTFCDVPLCQQCLHGTCVDENTCVCDSQYEGTRCSKPICSNCVYGVCIEPEVCNCFYGYTGEHCDQIVSYPLCVHGTPKIGDKCECEPGYKGRLCEIKICDNTNGDCDYCDDEGGCYLNIGKYCDSISPFCIECNDNKCTKCEDNYIIEDDNCVHISKKYPRCIKGTKDECYECEYPFILKEGKCYNGGMVELSQKHYTPFDTDEMLTIDVYRYYGTEGKCTINYEVFPINLYVFDYNYITNPIDKMEMSYGDITFEEGESEKKIELKLYRGIYHFDGYNHKNSFYITIYNPVGGCILGDIVESSIEIFEEEIDNEDNINIVLESTAIIESISPSSNLIYEFTSAINSISLSIIPSTVMLTFIDKFVGFCLVINKDTSTIENIIKMSSNAAKTKFIGILNYSDMKKDSSTDIKYILLMICKEESPFYKMKFYNHAGFVENETPFFIRHAKSIKLDDFYIKNKKTFYSIVYEFYIEILKNEFYLKISIQKQDELNLFINRSKATPLSSNIANNIHENVFNIKGNKYLEMVIRFVHTTGESIIKVEYSDDNINYRENNDCFISHICEEIQLFNIRVN